MSNGLNWHFMGVIAIFYRTLAIYENTKIQNTYGITLNTHSKWTEHIRHVGGVLIERQW